MTNQILVNNSSVSSSASAVAVRPPQTSAHSAKSSYESRLLEAMKTQYQLDQQVKFLHLQAEAESLLQQLQAIKQQKQAATDATTSQVVEGDRESA